MAQPQTLTGVVKTWGSNKGFGFISCDDSAQGDVYFQARDLPSQLQGFDRNVFDLTGKHVSFELHHTPDGKPQAKNVVPQYTANGPEQSLVGEVKSFNDQKGWGFITTPFMDGDVYFQKKDVPFELHGQRLHGMKVGFVLSQKPDGKYQARQLTFNKPKPGTGAMHVGGPPPSMTVGGNQMARAALAHTPLGEAMQQMHIPDNLQQAVHLLLTQGASGMQGARAPGATVPAGPPGAQGGDSTPLTGTVKTIDFNRGFGFIKSQHVAEDIYFKPQDPLQPGQTVSFLMRWTPDGKPQARNVAISIGPGEAAIGTIKSFSEKNGYGFMTVERFPADVYFMRKNLPQEMQASSRADLVGNQMQFVIEMTPDGKPHARDMCLVGGAPESDRAALDDGLNRSNGLGAKRPFAAAGPALRGTVGKTVPVGPAAKKARTMTSGEQATGTIKSYNPAKAFGFITSDDAPADVFFKGSMLPAEMQGGDLSLEGIAVSFQLNFTPDGKCQGRDISLLS